MTDLEKVQMAIELIREVKVNTREGSTIQMLLEGSIFDLESLTNWIKVK